MRFSTHVTVAALGLALSFGATALSAQPELILLSDAAAPGGVSAQDVTPDGLTVAGTSDGRAFRWTEGGAVEFLTPSDFLHTFDASVSDDGAVVASTLVNPGDNIVSAATWTQGGGWSFLGCLPGVIPTPEDPAQCSTAYDISGDAAVVVGLAWHGDTFRAEGFRWTSGSGMVGLGQPAGFSSRASAVSADGTVSGGFYEDESSGQRRPVRWIGTGAPDLFIDPQSIGEVNGISSTGHWLTGSALLLDSGGLPLPPWNFEKAFLYSDDAGFQYVLPHVDYDLGTEQRAAGNGVADNGMVVGWSGDMGPFGLVRAAIYCPGTERMVDLNQKLLDDGTDHSAQRLAGHRAGGDAGRPHGRRPGDRFRHLRQHPVRRSLRRRPVRGRDSERHRDSDPRRPRLRGAGARARRCRPCRSASVCDRRRWRRPQIEPASPTSDLSVG